MIDLTQQRLKQLLEYVPDTGQFVRRVEAGRQRAGTIAGVVDAEGYRVIKVDGRPFKAHRLAFLWMTGAFPKGLVDHANMNRDDNAWSNLREASRSQNKANSVAWSDKAFPLKGVFPRGKRFRANICKDGDHKYLGTFDTAQEAHQAYAQAAEKLFGDFARSS